MSDSAGSPSTVPIVVLVLELDLGSLKADEVFISPTRATLCPERTKKEPPAEVEIADPFCNS